MQLVGTCNCFVGVAQQQPGQHWCARSERLRQKLIKVMMTEHSPIKAGACLQADGLASGGYGQLWRPFPRTAGHEPQHVRPWQWHARGQTHPHAPGLRQLLCSHSITPQNVAHFHRLVSLWP